MLSKQKPLKIRRSSFQSRQKGAFLIALENE